MTKEVILTNEEVLTLCRLFRLMRIGVLKDQKGVLISLEENYPHIKSIYNKIRKD